MVKAIKRRNPIKRMLCDHLLYEDEDGEMSALRVGQWVDFKRKQSSRDYRRMMRFAAIAEMAEDEGGIAALGDELASMSEFIARKIKAWNWTDLDAELNTAGELPLLENPPTTETLDELDFEDTLHLFDMYMEGTSNAPKAS